MSTYEHYKVLRYPVTSPQIKSVVNRISDKLQVSVEEVSDDFCFWFERAFGDAGFVYAPTYPEKFIDYVIEHDWDDGYGEYGKIRELYESEKERYADKFKSIVPNVNINEVRLVEYCWYNCSEAPSYYDISKDRFYDEV